MDFVQRFMCMGVIVRRIEMDRAQERADVEWKFARSRLWISYFEEGGTCPPPFNIIPAPKSLWYIVQWMKKKFFGRSKTIKKEHMKTIRVSSMRRQFS